MPTPPARFALTRAVSPSFARALARHAPSEPIDVARAVRQHAAYVAALRALRLEVVALPPDPRYPDGCFVEDCALVAGGVALIARLGAEARRGEEEAVAEGLAPHLELARMAAPATLDGGDCLRLGRRIFIGRSQRTNDAGIARARELFAPRGFEVVAVDVTHALHLKSVCSPLGGAGMLLAAGTLAPECFAGATVLAIPAHELAGANAVSHQGAAVIASGCPETERIVSAAGFQTIAVDTSELRKADGALTCLSILF